MPDPDTLRDVQPAPFPPPGFVPLVGTVGHDGVVTLFKPRSQDAHGDR